MIIQDYYYYKLYQKY